MKKSHISKIEIRKGEEVKGHDIREGIFNLIQSHFPDFDKDDYISNAELNQYRRLYLTSLITQEKGELAVIDRDVMEAIKNNSILSENIQDEIEGQLTTGQKLADKIAEFGGSWTFIITFFSFILIWIVVNIWFLATQPFDPFPFILLNLFLSMIAAIQAPVILMSQNRAAHRDQARAELDLEKDLRDLHIDMGSHKILLDLKKDVAAIKKKLKLK